MLFHPLPGLVAIGTAVVEIYLFLVFHMIKVPRDYNDRSPST